MRLIFVILISTLYFPIFGQIYIGESTHQIRGNYSYLLHIKNDKSICFAYYNNETECYAEHDGFIKQINDTLYNILVTLTIGQFWNRSPLDDSFVVRVDSSLRVKANKIKLFNTNGQLIDSVNYSNYDKRWEQHNYYGFFSFPFKNGKINDVEIKKYIIVTLNKKNQITGEPLAFKIPLGTTAHFTCGDKLNFNIVKKNKQLWTIEKSPLQTGNFNLKIKRGP